MDEVQYQAGEIIIKEGDSGDYFYILEQGSAEAWKMKPGAFKPEMVRQYMVGDSFGELALLYNAPRAATIKATTDCILWALDRLTFRAILMTTTQDRRNLYEDFLKEVPLFESLDQYQRSAIADVLEPEYFDPEQLIIMEGARGDKFFILEEGEAMASSRGKLLTTYKRGDYFGELALLNDAPRAATVTAVTRCKVVSINRDQFKGLLGHLEDILLHKNNTDHEVITTHVL